MSIIWRDRTESTVKWGKRARGFTLLEVMVGAMLLLIVMAGLVPFFISGLSQSSAVRYRSTATNLAREKMEEIRQLDYREITGVAFLEETFKTEETVRDVTYAISYEVVETPYDAGVLKEVTVTVDWEAPPKVSPTSLTTMIHQQYVGPRISSMEVKQPDPIPDPAGSPFDMLQKGSTPYLFCHIAQTDWTLLIDDLNQPSQAVKDDIAMQLMIVNDANVIVERYDISSGYLVAWDEDGDDVVDDVYFQYPIDSTTLPDGYLWFLGSVSNEHGEPGNTWQLRFRVEDGGPSEPKWDTFEFYEGDDSVDLYWFKPDDGDVDYYCIQRRGKTDGIGPWVDVAMKVYGNNYLDQGDLSVDPPVAPWGTSSAPQIYEYRIWAVDTEGNPGAINAIEVTLPSGTATPVTTTSTTPTSIMPSIDYYNIFIQNNTTKTWTVHIVSADDPGVYYDVTVVKKSISTVSKLSAGAYHIEASTSSGGYVYTEYAFELPRDDDTMYDPVFVIN